MRIARTKDRATRGVQETGRIWLRSSGFHQGDGGVNVDSARPDEVAVGQRRYDSGQVHDGIRRNLCHQLLHGFGVSEVDAPGLDAVGQWTGGPMGGGNHVPAVGGELLDRVAAGQPEAAGYQYRL